MNDDRDIVVTASKREQNLQDVPLAITAIGTERLDELQVKEFQDVVKFLPSVTIQTAAPGFSQVYFRGVASGENDNHSASLPTRSEGRRVGKAGSVRVDTGGRRSSTKKKNNLSSRYK